MFRLQKVISYYITNTYVHPFYINSKLEKIVEFKERSGGIYSNFSRPIIAGLENNP